ncbi:MAG: chloride channel protein [Pseudomonadota bacterium]
MPDIIRRLPGILIQWITPNLRDFWDTRQLKIWLVSLLIGVCVSVAAIMFRELIGLFQWPWLRDMSENVASAARATHWSVVLLAPAFGGLIVGLLLQHWLPPRRTGGIADVIEARALGGRNIDFKMGIKSSIVTALSLGAGASAGREGPMVHLGATISTSIAASLRFPDWGRRTLLACGGAAAVSASFNAPIAGVLFAHEVILGHYAMRSFVPIVISSVFGTLLPRMWFGDVAAWSVPEYNITSYFEFPAFALLGLTCALVAVLFQFALISSDYIARNITMPLWLRPAIGGLLIGAIALYYPEVLGVGYEATDKALKNELPLTLLLALLIAKTIATAITLASRFGGGIVAPSLYLGAMAGGAFGLIAAKFLPEMASSQGLYSILGMGAVAAAVIGAPISTTVMVFELTGGYTLSIALLLVVSIAAGINQAIHGRSYFQWQLESRGLVVQNGPHRYLVRNTRVERFMAPLAEGETPEPHNPEKDPPAMKPSDTLEHALRMFDQGGHARLPVIDPNQPDRIIGWATQVAALRHFNRALIDVSEEEHR